jgi:23S rRNA (cytosine1962-C5)-methyltransferase
METLKTVIVRPGEADRVVAGHPWIYQGSILRMTSPPADGEWVQVKDHRQRLLGTGFFNARVEPDAAFFESRIRAALELRRRHLPEASSFRVVNAESDFLSGLILDWYEDRAVLQISSLGMDQRKGLIVEAVKKVLSPAGLYERADMAARKFEGLGESGGWIFGEDSQPVSVRMNGLRFQTEVGGGHKTGLYLDQQVNYARVARRVRPGDHVLDCFTFAGGFALHAARAGAARVLGIDQSEESIRQAAANAEANQLGDRCRFEAANVFDWLKQETAARPHEKVVPRFDCIILDPPSFTRSRATVADALRGYKEIHLRALKLLKPGGTLATFCCSHHVDAALFQQVILDAAYDARRVLRRVAVYSQAPDHPVLPSIPETEYLKGFAFELAR